MTYRGVFKDGVIVLRGDSQLSDGDLVEIRPAGRVGGRTEPRGRSNRGASARGRNASKGVRSRGKPTRAQIEAALRAFGAWKPRRAWKGKGAVEITDELRKRALGRFGTRA